MRCTNCGNKIKGKKPVVSGANITRGFGFLDNGKEVVEKVNLCSWDCAWEWGIEEHILMGKQEAIKHLIKLHGYPKTTKVF